MTRYTVTMDFYIHTETDEGARKKARKIAELLNDKYDNEAAVISIHATPFATLKNRKVKLED